MRALPIVLLAMLMAAAVPARAEGTGHRLYLAATAPGQPTEETSSGWSDKAVITAIGAIAGASIGTEIVVITVGIVAGSTVSWWLLGGLGFAAGGLAGGAAGSYIADAVADKKPARRH